MKILLDAGHGGYDPGAVANDTREKDITLLIVTMTGNLLKTSGIDVLYTREFDTYVSPSDRLRMINNIKPDAFLSVHCNAVDNETANGIETIYRDKYDYDLAVCIQNSLVKAEGLRDRGVKSDVRKLAVLSNLQVPACLCEVGFISNIKDVEVLKQTDIIAVALVKGIEIWQKNL